MCRSCRSYMLNVTGHEQEGRYKISDRLPEQPRQTKDETVMHEQPECRNFTVCSPYRAGPTVTTTTRAMNAMQEDRGWHLFPVR
jgi:hypothetical protein